MICPTAKPINYFLLKRKQTKLSKWPDLACSSETLPPEFVQAIVKVFKKESNNTPPWMFLQWRNQILALVSSSGRKDPVITALAPLITSMASKYPEPMKFSYQCSRDHMVVGASPEMKGLVQKLDGMLDSKNQLLSQVLDGISNICFPEVKAKDFLEEILRRNLEDPMSATEVKANWEKLKNEVELNDRSAGGVNKKFASKFKSDLNSLFDRLGSALPKDFVSKVRGLYNRVWLKNDSFKKGQNQSNLLKEYSPFLDTFCQSSFFDEVSMFGQFDGDAEPGENPVTISRYCH